MGREEGLGEELEGQTSGVILARMDFLELLASLVFDLGARKIGSPQDVGEQRDACFEMARQELGPKSKAVAARRPGEAARHSIDRGGYLVGAASAGAARHRACQQCSDAVVAVGLEAHAAQKRSPDRHQRHGGIAFHEKGPTSRESPSDETRLALEGGAHARLDLGDRALGRDRHGQALGAIDGWQSAAQLSKQLALVQ